MTYIKQFVNIFVEPVKKLASGQWEMLDIWTIIFRIGMLAGVFGVVYFTIKYLRDYRIFEGLYAKLKGDIQAYDRVKRSQMRTNMEANADSFIKKKDEKESILDRLYMMIAHTGITEIVPGFSEIGFAILLIFIAILLFVILSVIKSVITGFLTMLAFLIITWYVLDLIAYSRKIRMEKQLLQFINTCSSASLQFSNIIDIFGAVYDQFSSPLREGLEACYVEAKTTNDKALALKHLKNRYDSSQFSFIIDNLEMCSSVTGDYHATAKDVSETVSIYSASHEKKRMILRNAKVNIIVMFVMMIGILYLLSMFLGSITHVMFDTVVGNIITLAMVLILFYGLNIKTEK